MRPNQTLGFEEVYRFLAGLFDGDLHAKRGLSLANATLGAIRTAPLAVNTIGQGLALAGGRVTKHAIKQVDRLLSHEGIDLDAALGHRVPYLVGPRTSINVAMDWTDFDADGQATIMLSLLTRRGLGRIRRPGSRVASRHGDGRTPSAPSRPRRWRSAR